MVFNQSNPAEMVFVEEWTDGQALDRHLSDPFIAGVVEQAAPLLAQPLTLHRYLAVA